MLESTETTSRHTTINTLFVRCFIVESEEGKTKHSTLFGHFLQYHKPVLAYVLVAVAAAIATAVAGAVVDAVVVVGGGGDVDCAGIPFLYIFRVPVSKNKYHIVLIYCVPMTFYVTYNTDVTRHKCHSGSHVTTSHFSHIRAAQ